MPNGVSCAYFAVRNHIYGKKENNVFKEGIAGAQSVRAADAVSRSGIVNSSILSPFSKFLGKAAAFARKIVYPLIIASGVYNTAVSDDKVRTGASQAGGIATMYTFEKVAEKGLNSAYKRLSNTNAVKNNNAAKIGLYAVKGLMFVAASLTGYNTGSKVSEEIVDKIRKHKTNSEKIENNTQSFPIEDDITPDRIEDTLFKDMQL